MGDDEDQKIVIERIVTSVFNGASSDDAMVIATLCSNKQFQHFVKLLSFLQRKSLKEAPFADANAAFTMIGKSILASDIVNMVESVADVQAHGTQSEFLHGDRVVF